MEQDDDDKKKRLRTMLAIVAVVAALGVALFSAVKSMTPEKENITYTIPPGPGGGGMRDAERR